MTLARGPKLVRWIATAIFLAAGYRIALWHHDDPLALLVATPAFWIMLCAWINSDIILVLERRISKN